MIRPALALLLVALAAAPALADGPADDEALAWSKKVEETLRARDAASLDGSFDFDKIGEHAFKGLTVKDATKEEFLSGLKKGKGYGTALLEKLGKKGGVRFVGLVKRGDASAAVFRVAPESGGYFYHEFILGKAGDGKVRVVDTLAYASGIKLASQARQEALAVAIKEDPANQDRLEGLEAERSKHRKDLQDVWKLQGEEKWLDALDGYKKLPDSVRLSRMVLLMQLMAARHVGAEAKDDILDVLEKKFANDPTVALVLLETATQEQDWKRALAALDTLDRATGGDSYLDYQRCDIEFKANHLEAAKTAGLKAIEKEPELVPAQWAVVGLANKTKDWEGVAAGLARLEKQGVKIPNLEKVAAYGDFVKTDEFQAWKKEHEEKK